MSFSAQLFINGEVRNILHARQVYSKFADISGKPTATVTGRPLSFQIESTRDDTFFYDMMISPDAICEGEVVFYKRDGLGTLYKIEFANAYIIGLSENFDANGTMPLHLNISIGWGIMRIKGVTFEEKWNPSNPFIAGANATTVATTPVTTTQQETATEEEEAEEEVKDFNIAIEQIVNKKTFVPLGVPGYKNKEENEFIEFEIEISENEIENFKIEIFNGTAVIQTYHSGTFTSDPILITAKAPANTGAGTSTAAADTAYKPGKYTVKWDGFDNKGIYDSTVFSSGTFKAKVTGNLDGVEKTDESDTFTFKSNEVKWVDVKIDSAKKQIDVTLRVDLEDGGAEGLKKGKKVPKASLIYGDPISVRTKSFSDLEKMALDGIDYHWSRNSKNSVAKNVTIQGELYALFVKSVNTSKKSMDDVDLIYNTNRKWLRSGNPGTVEGLVSLVGNIVSREAICYNIGYIKYSNGWSYSQAADEDVGFRETSAHEIGHTILKAYGGTSYSYGHKGSVNTVTQSTSSSATNYPKSGEIDLMKYFKNRIPTNAKSKMVASGEDALSLVWLTKLKIK